MSPPEFLIACVGKPSAGKSSFLNAITNARAKVGAFPFTTIQPNEGVAYLSIRCPCNGSEHCRPRYGGCVAGKRRVPVRVLDVAGLIPGAHQGHGLGNQFLNDLRQANLLLHILDVSGTTDATGKETQGYDPTVDVAWLIDELELWIWGNMVKLWPAVMRKMQHSTQNNSMPITGGDWVDILQKTCSGYGCSRAFCQQFAAKLPAELAQKPLAQWDDDVELRRLVQLFVRERFPMVLVLNKIDLADADRNIQRIIQRYPELVQDRMVFTSALGELFLRKLHDSQLIHYVEGTDQIYTAEDPPPLELNVHTALKPMDDKTKARLEKVVDLVLFRYGSTGCQQALRCAADVLRLLPVFPVRSIHNHQPVPLLFCNTNQNSSGQQSSSAVSTIPSADTESGSGGKAAHAIFRDCFLIAAEVTIHELTRMLFSQMVLEKHSVQVESATGRAMSDDDTLPWSRDAADAGVVLAFKLRDSEGRA